MNATINEKNGYLNIVASSFGKLTLKVFDTNGKIAQKIYKDIKEGVQQMDLQINEWAAGTYILNAFSGDNFLKSFRLTKQ